MSKVTLSKCEEYNFWKWNGFNICWRVSNENDQVAILLIHGFGASSLHWRNNINYFANRGYAVYSIDLLGFGQSDQPGLNQIEKLDNAVWSDQVHDFIQEVIRPVNKKKVIIIGNSLGGLVALTSAVAFPEEIAGIIASPLPDPISIKIKKKLYKSRLGDIKVLLIKWITKLLPLEILLFIIVKFNIITIGLKSAYSKQIYVDKEIIDIVTKPVLRATAAKALRSMVFGMSIRSNKLKSTFLLSQLRKSGNVPFLLIWGEKDNFIPLIFGKRIAKFHTWVELRVISNSGHCVHDEDHSKFNEISHQWITELNL